MKDLYPGNNTKISRLVANLQLQYDLKTNTIDGLSIRPNKKYVRPSLKGIRLTLKKSGKLIVAKDVFTGHRKYHPCRIIISLIPEEKAKIRRQKQKRKSQKRSAKTTDPYILALADLNILVTNTTEEQHPTIQVYNMYKLRWQIELIF